MACKVFLLLCCFRSGNACVLQTGPQHCGWVRPLAHTESGQHSFHVVALVYICVKGVGIQPFADRVFPWLSGLITILYILHAFIMQLGLYLN